MDTLRIYRYSLVLPLVVPILAALLLYGLVELFPATEIYEQRGPWRDGLGLILLMIAGSGVVGGIPYLILAALLWREMKEMNERQVRISIVWLPILMIIFFGVILAVFVPFAEGFNTGALSRFFIQWLTYSAFTLVLGYCYVSLMFGLVRILRKRWPEWSNARKPLSPSSES